MTVGLANEAITQVPTRCSHEMRSSLFMLPTFSMFSNIAVLCTPIPNCGQLNITTSTLSSLTVSVKSRVISVLEAAVHIVSS